MLLPFFFCFIEKKLKYIFGGFDTKLWINFDLLFFQPHESTKDFDLLIVNVVEISTHYKTYNVNDYIKLLHKCILLIVKKLASKEYQKFKV